MPFDFPLPPPPTPVIIRQVEIPDPNQIKQFNIIDDLDGTKILQCIGSNCIEFRSGWFPRLNDDEHTE